MWRIFIYLWILVGIGRVLLWTLLEMIEGGILQDVCIAHVLQCVDLIIHPVIVLPRPCLVVTHVIMAAMVPGNDPLRHVVYLSAFVT